MQLPEHPDAEEYVPVPGGEDEPPMDSSSLINDRFIFQFRSRSPGDAPQQKDEKLDEDLFTFFQPVSAFTI